MGQTKHGSSQLLSQQLYGVAVVTEETVQYLLYCSAVVSSLFRATSLLVTVQFNNFHQYTKQIAQRNRS